MPTRESKILEEVKETTAIAARIVALTSKEKNAAARALGKLGARKRGRAKAKSPSAKPRPEKAKAAKSRQPKPGSP